MLIALFTDIHANLPALEAVMKEARALRPDRMLSLGDQVNLGPEPQEVIDCLRQNRVECLRGNHERYLLECMDGNSAYDAVNFASVRFWSRRLKRADLDLPMTLRLEEFTFCHALPDDDRFPVYLPEKALPLLTAAAETLPAHIVCGHGHNARRYAFAGHTLDCLGSLGCQDRGIPGAALWNTLETDGRGGVLTPHFTVYDPSPLKERWRTSGLADAAPVFSHVLCLQMTLSRNLLLPFLDLCRDLTRARHADRITPEIWREADERFPWPDGKGTAAFWGKND